jgi:hypothetical protein
VSLDFLFGDHFMLSENKKQIFSFKKKKKARITKLNILNITVNYTSFTDIMFG